MVSKTRLRPLSKLIPTRFVCIWSLITAICLWSIALAAEPAPGDACSTTNLYMVSGGPENNGKVYLMTCQGGVWTRLLETATNGYVGVGAALPSATLQVNATSAGAKSSIFRGASSQSANLMEWQNSSGTALSFVASSGAISLPDVVYSAGWDGSLEAPTKNAVYDKIQTLGGGGSPAGGDRAIQFNNASSTFGGAYTFVYTSAGKVGIGTAAPNAPLTVNGEIKLSSGSLACNSSSTGALRFLAASACVQFCNGASWGCIGGCDDVPNTFSFTDTNNANLSNNSYASNIVAITGIDAGCPTTVAVTGGPQWYEFRICGDHSCNSPQAWRTTSLGTDMNGKFIQVRGGSAATTSTSHDITAIVGGVPDTWSLTTHCDGRPAAYDFTDQTGLTRNSLVSSNIVAMTGTETGCVSSISFSQVWGGGGTLQARLCSDSSCNTVVQNWSNSPVSWDVNGKYLQIRSTTSSAWSTARWISVNVGDQSGATNDNWYITTEDPPCDLNPDQFEWVDQTGLGWNAEAWSEIIPITGVDPSCASTVSITGFGGYFFICDDDQGVSCDWTWRTGPYSVELYGKYIFLHGFTDYGSEVTTNHVVSIENVSDTWTLTTAP